MFSWNIRWAKIYIYLFFFPKQTRIAVQWMLLFCFFLHNKTALLHVLKCRFFFRSVDPLMKWPCYDIFWHFFISWIQPAPPPPPLINRLNWVCGKIRFHKDIQILSSKYSTPQSVCQRRVKIFQRNFSFFVKTTRKSNANFEGLSLTSDFQGQSAKIKFLGENTFPIATFLTFENWGSSLKLLRWHANF